MNIRSNVRSGAARAILLALAPILALAACDRAAEMLDKIQAGIAPKDAGPAPLSSVALLDRAVGGAIGTPEEMAATLAPEPVMFVPGEILIGAKVDEAIAALAPKSSLRSSFSAETPGPVDPALEKRATEAAVTEAAKDAKTVLARLGVDATVDAQAGGVLKIDLTPERGSPTQLKTGDAAPEGAAAELEPALAVEDVGAKCPRNVTEEQLEADLTLKTICALDRLQASRQFEYVEKNYVVTVGFDRAPWMQPKPKPSTPATKPTTPSTPAMPTPTTPTTPTTTTPATPATPPVETAFVLPNDPLLALQWHLRPRGVGLDKSPGGAGFEDFWLKKRQVGSRSVRVAVIDTGIDMSHPDIAGSPNIGPGIDLVSNLERSGDGDGIDSDPNDAGDRCGVNADSFHGTHVAGTIGAAITNDRKGVAGAVWDVTIIPIRAIGRCGGELDDIVNGVRWAAGLAPAQADDGRLLVNQNPADIINMSLSVGIPCPASLQSAIDAAVARGVVIVVAAGNKAAAVKLYAPANCANVIVVAANDARGNLAYYSNFGPEVDVLAPGGDVFADSDGDGRPDGVLSTRASGKDCFDPESGLPAEKCWYGYLQGTSMATPHVSAALALLKAQYNLTGARLIDALYTRALAPIAPAQCSIACDKNAAAEPIPGQPGQCMRPCGQGMLDLSRAATAP